MSLTRLGKYPRLDSLVKTSVEYHSTLRRIFDEIRVDRDKGCWFLRKDWSTYTTINGEKAHRYMYRAYNPGQSITGFEICHKCDRRGCINPDHLFRGTHSDNMKDAKKKGRLVGIKILDKEKITRKEFKELWEKDNWKRLVRFAGE